MYTPYKLPEPDTAGNYWLTKSEFCSIVIYPVRSHKNSHLGEYYAAGSDGFYTDSYGDFVYFKTALLALEYLNEKERELVEGSLVCTKGKSAKT